MDRFLDQETRSGRAYLALTVEDSRLGAAHGGLQVGIGENDVGTLAAKLHRDALIRLGGHLHDLAAHFGRSRKRDLVDIWVTDERGTRCRPATRHDVERARRQPRLERNLREEQGGERCLRRGLEDDGAAGREGRGELPARDVEREVPRHNRPDDPDRLAQRVRKKWSFNRKRVANDLVCPPGVVTQGIDRHPDLDLRFEQRLAVLSRLEPGDLIQPRFQQIRSLKEESPPLSG